MMLRLLRLLRISGMTGGSVLTAVVERECSAKPALPASRLRCTSDAKMTIGHDRNNQCAANTAGRQSRLMSLVESTTNAVVGFLLALATQFVVFPLFGLAVSVASNILIGAVFTIVSLARSYVLRR